MSPFVYFLVHLTFFYTCVEGLVINLMFPATLPFIYKDLVLVVVYVGVIVPNVARVLDPPPIIRTVGVGLALFFVMLMVYVLVPSPVTLLSELVAVKQRLFYIPLSIVAYFFVRRVDDLKGLVAAMAIYAAGVSIFGIYLFFSGPEALARLGGTYAAIFYTPVTTQGGMSVWRVPGTFTSSGQYGGYLAFNAIVIAALLAMPRTRAWMRVVAGGALVLIVLAMLVSGSRTSIVVASAGIALAIMMSGRVARLGAWAIAGYAILAYAFVVLGPGVQDRFDSIVSAENVARFQRTYFGQLFLSSVFADPLGRGLGIATIGARHFTEFSQLVFMESYFGILAVETGLPGILTFGFVALAIVALIVQHRRLMSTSPDGPLWLGLAAYVLLIVSLLPVSTTIDHAPSNFYFWFSLGVIVRLIELEYWRQWEERRGQAAFAAAEYASPSP